MLFIFKLFKRLISLLNISISDLNYENRELKLRLDSFLTNSKSNFITQIFGIDYLSGDSIKDIDLNGDLSLSEDSLNFKSNVRYGDSFFDIMTKKIEFTERAFC